MYRVYFIVLVVLLALFASACTGQLPAASQDTGAEVQAAVEATLTAVVQSESEKVEDTASDSPEAAAPRSPGDTVPAIDDNPPTAESEQMQAVAPAIVLPPIVENFNPVPRPAATLGDPEAPVVMYEWSDYT
ncbi:MAG: hypothetical protein GY759_21960 [Chloroflexi bacterium]|nr:hypothetical protein [Chloroflexota bacterium]